MHAGYAFDFSDLFDDLPFISSLRRRGKRGGYKFTYTDNADKLSRELA